MAMRPRFALPLALLLLSLGVLAGCPKKGPEAAPEAEPPGFVYPDARRGEVVDDYFGTQVADPYRWLEEPDSEETRTWVEAQNALTQGYIGAIPERERIHRRLTKLWDFERFGTPQKAGERWIWSYNSGLQDQSVIYVGKSLDGEGSVLLDPNTFSEDGTVALAGMEPSPDGRWLAYAISDGGSDWKSWKVMDIKTKEEGPDLIEWTKFGSVSWHPDGSGFWYGRFPEPENPLEAVNTNYQLWWHTLGDAQADDRLVYEDPENPKEEFFGFVTDDGEWLVVYVFAGTDERNRLWVRRVDEPEAEFDRILDDFDAGYLLIANEGSKLWLQTNKDAPKGRIILVNVDNPQPKAWSEIVPEADEVIEGSSSIGGKLIVRYLKDAHSVVRVFERDGTATGEVPLPGMGSAWGFDGDQSDEQTFFTYASFTTPSSIYRYTPATNEVSLWKAPAVDWDPDAFVTTQVFYDSADGTKVPMFLTHRKDVQPTGDVPTLLYGYGGFNISITPYYSLNLALWAEMGGLVAVANLRGGGEYGEEWHEAGTKLNKQNVFDDFVAAAEHLQQDWTSPARTTIYGGSNGGLLVGAVMTQRPDVARVAIPVVGVLDMLRYHLFTIGWAWADDYGRSDEEEMFAYLHGYSPLHNLDEGVDYPSTLVFTGDHDDRVVPAHSYKFSAELQRVHGGETPVMIRIETRAGHSAGKSTSQRIDEAADRWAFCVKELGWELPAGWGVAPAEPAAE
jgi:prolyl oligopeptidase